MYEEDFDRARDIDSGGYCEGIFRACSDLLDRFCSLGIDKFVLVSLRMAAEECLDDSE